MRTHANVIPGGTLGSRRKGGQTCRRDVWVFCTHARAGLVSLEFTLVKVGKRAARFLVKQIREECVYNAEPFDILYYMRIRRNLFGGGLGSFLPM